MKKFLLLLLCALLSFSTLFACSKKYVSETVYYSIVFKQDGQEDIVKVVKKGEELKDLPTPVEKTGYDIVWSQTEFKDVQSDITVWARETAKSYTVTFDPAGGEVSTTTQTVTYDATPEKFPVPTRDEYVFVCWLYGTTAVLDTTYWAIAQDVTLTASWVEDNSCTVTFVQYGQEPVHVVVESGTGVAASQIPELFPRDGYDVAWEVVDLSTITESITVNAVYTPNEYQITLVGGKGEFEGLDTKVVTVSKGALVSTLLKPTLRSEYFSEGLPDYTFKGWKYGDKTLKNTDALTFTAREVTLTAIWGDLWIGPY